MPSYSFNLNEKSKALELGDGNDTKPFLGGYRHKLTGKEFHHASIQTLLDRNNPKVNQAPCRFCRETQTKICRAKYTSTGCESETQTETYEGNGEILLYAKPYTSSSLIFQHKHSKARVLQQFWRALVAQSTVKRLKRDFQRNENAKRLEEMSQKQKEKERKEWEMNRRTKPRTRQDFNLLREDIDIWRDAEVAAIKTNTTAHDDKGLHLDLLYKEIKLLQVVDSLKGVATHSQRRDRTAATLGRLSIPKHWPLKRSSGFIKVYTPVTVKAKKLQDLYKDLMKDLPFKARLDTLEKIREGAKGFYDSTVTTEFCNLIDRELEMLRRGRPSSALLGLRKRLSLTFHQLIDHCREQTG